MKTKHGSGLKMIAESLKQSCSSSLLSLNLDRCTNIKPEGWACFSDLLCHLVMLQELSLTETTIPLESVCCIFSNKRSLHCKTKTFRL